MGFGVTWGSVWGGGGDDVEDAVLSDFGPFHAAIARGNAGRIQAQNWEPPAGEWVMCLGSDEPGHFGKFNDGDNLDVSQTVDFGSALFVRPIARVRGPSETPGSTKWYIALLIDNIEYTRREVWNGKTRDLSDMGANLTHLSPGPHALHFRLVFSGGASVSLAEMPAFYLDALTLDLP